MLPETDKEQYVKTVSMILEMDQAELIASDDFKNGQETKDRLMDPSQEDTALQSGKDCMQSQWGKRLPASFHR